MKYYQKKFETSGNNESILKSLKTMIKRETNDIFIFPFCLFNKSYYQMLKRTKNSPFTGKVSSNNFEFERLIIYGNLSSGSRTSRVLRLKGEIIENNIGKTIKVEFHSSQFEIFARLIITVCCLTLFVIKGNYLFIVIPVLIILDVIYSTSKYYLFIKKRIEKK